MAKITPSISGNFLVNVAQNYTDFNRIIMEFIDNSLDAAESLFEGEAYKREINININVSDDKIIIKDNCLGMDDLNKLLHTGESQKKADFTTNGQFGFGIMSFMAVCESLEFYSKNNGQCKYIRIPRNEYKDKSITDVRIEEQRLIECNNFGISGTEVVLSKFDQDALEKIDKQKLKEEIQNHFGVLLKRKNLTIKLNEGSCIPFDYTQYEGEEIKRKETELAYYYRNEFKCYIPLKTPLEIYLKFAFNHQLNNPVIFTNKGRRINLVTKVGYKSDNRYGMATTLWGNKNLTGYIELGGNVNPVLDRTKFKPSRELDIIYDYMRRKIEPKLSELNAQNNRRKTAEGYSDFASKLEAILTEIAKEDNLLHGAILEQKEDEQGDRKGRGVEVDGRTNKKRSYITHNKDYRKKIIPDEQGDKKYKEEKSSQTIPGFKLEFSDSNPPKNINDSEERTEIIDDQQGVKKIVFYTNHKEFKDRLDTSSRKGDIKITINLINYIANEIAVYYKDLFYEKNDKPDDTLGLFNDFIELVYKLERGFRIFEDQSLSAIKSN